MYTLIDVSYGNQITVGPCLRFLPSIGPIPPKKTIFRNRVFCSLKLFYIKYQFVVFVKDLKLVDTLYGCTVGAHIESIVGTIFVGGKCVGYEYGRLPIYFDPNPERVYF